MFASVNVPDVNTITLGKWVLLLHPPPPAGFSCDQFVCRPCKCRRECVRMGGLAGVRVCMRVRYVYMCVCVYTHTNTCIGIYPHIHRLTLPQAKCSSFQNRAKCRDRSSFESRVKYREAKRYRHHPEVKCFGHPPEVKCSSFLLGRAKCQAAVQRSEQQPGVKCSSFLQGRLKC